MVSATTPQALGELLVQSEKVNDPGEKGGIFPLLGYLYGCVDLWSPLLVLTMEVNTQVKVRCHQVRCQTGDEKM